VRGWCWLKPVHKERQQQLKRETKREVQKDANTFLGFEAESD
jgi:hypothetical protein